MDDAYLNGAETEPEYDELGQGKHRAAHMGDGNSGVRFDRGRLDLNLPDIDAPSDVTPSAGEDPVGDETPISDDGADVPVVSLPPEPDLPSAGAGVSSWTLKTLSDDRMESLAVPHGNARRARRVKKLHKASKRARSKRVREHRGYGRVVAAVLVVLAIAGGVVAGFAYVKELWGGKVVPNVEGLSQNSAIDELEAKGFEVEVIDVVSDAMQGRAVAVDPAEGERIPAGSKVTVSVGVDRRIPDVVGMTREEAREALEEAGATNIRFETKVTTKAKDKVVEVRPEAGAVFISSDEVTVFVSKLPQMLDVVGESEETALDKLDREGIAVEVSYEPSERDMRLKVLSTTPAAGEDVGSDGAHVVVGAPLTDILRLEDYFDTNALRVQSFVTSQGWEPTMSHLSSDDKETMVAGFTAPDGVTTLVFASDPWLRAHDTDRVFSSDVMHESVRVGGARLHISLKGSSFADQVYDPALNEATARQVMDLCGFESIRDSCTEKTIIIPKSMKGTKASHLFYCCSGELDDKYIWTVLIRGNSTSGGGSEATDIIATCAPRSTYSEVDLSEFGDAICDFVAFEEEYLR